METKRQKAVNERLDKAIRKLEDKSFLFRRRNDKFKILVTLFHDSESTNEMEERKIKRMKGAWRRSDTAILEDLADILEEYVHVIETTDLYPKIQKKILDKLTSDCDGNSISRKRL